MRQGGEGEECLCLILHACLPTNSILGRTATESISVPPPPTTRKLSFCLHACPSALVIWPWEHSFCTHFTPPHLCTFSHTTLPHTHTHGTPTALWNGGMEELLTFWMDRPDSRHPTLPILSLPATASPQTFLSHGRFWAGFPRTVAQHFSLSSHTGIIRQTCLLYAIFFRHFCLPSLSFCVPCHEKQAVGRITLRRRRAVGQSLFSFSFLFAHTLSFTMVKIN